MPYRWGGEHKDKHENKHFHTSRTTITDGEEVTCLASMDEALAVLKAALRDQQNEYFGCCEAESPEQAEKGSDCCAWCDLGYNVEADAVAIADRDAHALLTRENHVAYSYESPDQRLEHTHSVTFRAWLQPTPRNLCPYNDDARPLRDGYPRAQVETAHITAYIAAAHATGRVINDNGAKAIARQFQWGGGYTALYALAETGAMDTARLRRELDEAMRGPVTQLFQQWTRALRDYVDHHGDRGSQQPAWSWIPY